MSPRAAALVAAAVIVAGCGGGDDGPLRPQLDQIAPAIDAVEAELGGPQAYFEINATPQLVNVFVATADGTGVRPFVFVGDEVAPAGDASTAEGSTFVRSALTFDADTILDGLTTEVPESDIVRFTILGGPGGAVQYSATLQSERGGTLDVLVHPDGSTEPLPPGT